MWSSPLRTRLRSIQLRERRNETVPNSPVSVKNCGRFNKFYNNLQRLHNTPFARFFWAPLIDDMSTPKIRVTGTKELPLLSNGLHPDEDHADTVTLRPSHNNGSHSRNALLAALTN